MWQLRIGDYRVFYDILEGEEAVWVHALRWKGRQATEDILQIGDEP